MKKEYHYTISRTDRIYLVTFCMVLLGWELVKKVIPSNEDSYTYISEPSEINHHTKKDYPSYEKKNYSRKHKNYPTRNYPSEKEHDYRDKAQLLPPSQPIVIDQASVEQLNSMGFSKKTAFNIHKYLQAGGKINTELQLMKIYGMDSTQLRNALPYLILQPQSSSDDKALFTSKKIYKKLPAQIINLNSATQEELESLNGIGTVLAERIIKFRETLGGFISPEQLGDCYGMPPETLEKILPQLQAVGSPTLIAINETNFSTLVHPYLSKKLARMTQAYKDHHGPFLNAEELRKAYPADSTWCNKILPYLSFEIEENDN